MTETVTEDVYDVLENDDGDLLFVLSARGSDPDRPYLVYAGGSQAWLIRTPGQTVYLPELHPDALEPLAKAQEVTVAELYDDDIVRGYKVPVRASAGHTH